ncbi:MAG: 4'-phosphopantetheinyl transferase [Sedimentitalea sp.]
MIHATQFETPVQIGETLAGALFDPCVAISVTDPRAPHHRVLEQESAALQRAVPARQRAFAAGRSAARRAMAKLNKPISPVLMGTDRAPIWPPGLVGSLSHSQTCCIAALARAQDCTSLGVDVEERTGLDPDLFDIVCTAAERKWLAQFPANESTLHAKLIFSAKETAFKAQYPLSKCLLGFDRFEIALDLGKNRFSARFTQDTGPFARNSSLVGGFASERGLIVTALTVFPR